MKIDIFTHLLPQSFLEDFMSAVGPDFYLRDLPKQIPELVDIPTRIALMDELGIDKQVITLPTPPIEEVITDPVAAHRLAQKANDAMAEVGAASNGRFLPVGTIAMNNMEQAAAEAERCVKELGLKGVLIYTNAAGSAIDADKFLPFYEAMEAMDAPIWLHPARTPMRADYLDEDVSQYAIWQIFGWPYETSMAMTRLIFKGVMDRVPEIKFITHHAGAMIPAFDKRIELVYPLFDHMGNLGDTYKNLKKPILDYYRMFYNDTALMGSIGGMAAAYAFFGAEKLLFGTDTPFDTVGGRIFNEEAIASIESLAIPPAEREKIYSGNAIKMLGLE
ncbi:MAG: amidohydrolase [Immundisolibacteraceae bacterium]|nr:amidohydrolase [Immundisolibacteraceae bacterium]